MLAHTNLQKIRRCSGLTYSTEFKWVDYFIYFYWLVVRQCIITQCHNQHNSKVWKVTWRDLTRMQNVHAYILFDEVVYISTHSWSCCLCAFFDSYVRFSVTAHRHLFEWSLNLFIFKVINILVQLCRLFARAQIALLSLITRGSGPAQ